MIRWPSPIWWFGLIVVWALSACAPGTEGILITNAQAQEIEVDTIPDGPPIVVALPAIPIVRLPALSAATEYDEFLQQRLGGLASTSLQGLEVVDVECQNGEIVYSGDHTNDIFASSHVGYGESFSFEVGEDGSAWFVSETPSTKTRVRTLPDGSGDFIEEGHLRTVSIAVEADGSGEYFSQARNGDTTTVAANDDGSGVFYRSEYDTLLTVTLLSDGGGELYSGGPGQWVTIEARADGSGEMFYLVGEREVTVRVESTGAWQIEDSDFDHVVSLRVEADGTGQYRQRGTGPALTLDFAADGSTAGPDIVVPERPVFAVTDQFPKLGSLAAIKPPCATVVRFDSSLLFEVNKAELRPAARGLLAEVAPALIEAGRTIEINGHTDATGSDEYNADLSLRRAEAVAAELRNLGVGVSFTVQGFGESQPIAPNYREDGSDDAAGQSQNRRVELVIR